MNQGADGLKRFLKNSWTVSRSRNDFGSAVSLPFRMEDPMEAVKDSKHLYEVERRAEHAARPGFRITELQISKTQKVPWHFHNNVQDTFYVLNGNLRIFLREPKEEVRLGPGDTCSVKPRRPHLVTNGGDTSATFLVLQGIGDYDFVPLV
jgi:quercetin dioxygenase-like cupin family protein